MVGSEPSSLGYAVQDSCPRLRLDYAIDRSLTLRKPNTVEAIFVWAI